MLAPHQSSSPQRPPVIDIWAIIKTPHNEELHFSIVAYAQLYAANRWLTDVLNGHSYRWIDNTAIHVTHPDTNNTLILKSNRLEDALEFLPTPEQSHFRFEYPDSQLIRRLNRFYDLPHYSTTPTPTTPTADTPPLPPTPRPIKTNHDPHKSRKPATTPTAITVAQIADSLGISGNKARNILRSSNEPKPPQGRWEYTSPTDIERITKLLSSGK